MLCFYRPPRLLTLEIFCQPPRLLHPPRLLFWLKFASIPVYYTLSVYYFDWNLPASPFITPSPFIILTEICQHPRLLHPPRLLFWLKFASIPVYSALPVYYFDWNLPASPFIPTSPFIILTEIWQHPRLFRPLLLFETREYFFNECQQTCSCVGNCSHLLKSTLNGSLILWEVNISLFISLLESNEPTYTWSGQLPPRNYKNPIYSNKIFLGGVPWDITEGKELHILDALCNLGNICLI